MSGAVATVCGLCPAGEAGLAGKLRGALADTGLMIEVRSSGCMSGCTRQSTLAFRAPGKMAYLFGEITLADLPELLTFARLYLASPDGDLADAVDAGHLWGSAVMTAPTNSPPPRGLGFSADKFAGSGFRVTSDFDRADDGLGRATITQGLVVITPIL